MTLTSQPAARPARQAKADGQIFANAKDASIASVSGSNRGEGTDNCVNGSPLIRSGFRPPTEPNTLFVNYGVQV